MNQESKTKHGLYCPDLEHDSCGIGFVANLKGRASHDIIENALSMLTCMEHRGGTGYDVKSGDGAGILIQIPHQLLADDMADKGVTLPASGQYGAGMIFFPKEENLREACRDVLVKSIEKLGLKLLGFRIVPTDNSTLGQAPKDNEPQIEQCFITADGLEQQALERKLYILRKYTTNTIRENMDDASADFYIASLSTRTMVYKGQLTTAQVREYYLDLQNPKAVSSLAMHHSRFSTNTFPAWRRAQPFRYLSHNGEINTVKGNINWMKARDDLLSCDYFSAEELDMLRPLCNPNESDSANLDMVIELLVLSGRPLEKVMMMVIPEAWQRQQDMEPMKRAFYEYYACIMEPWDGPASVSFTDGRVIGATLDRNGLRPSRYLVTDDDTIVMGSETGALVVDQSKVVYKGRLQPGKIFIADLEQGRIISDDEIKETVCSGQPYAQWLKDNLVKLKDLPDPAIEERPHGPASLRRRQQAFGYSQEDLDVILADMVGTAKEPLGSMGADNPLAVLSDQPQHLANYFKQFFAQVTNPPIDPIREEMVMSTTSYVGMAQNLLAETAAHCRMVEIDQPVLSNEQLRRLQHIQHKNFKAVTLDMIFPASNKPGTLEAALEKLCVAAKKAVDDGASILVLSDRNVDADNAGIPSLLATSAVHHHLIRAGIRAHAGIIVEAGDVRETHHFATLIGYGAAAVNPYLAFETLFELRDSGAIDASFSNEELTNRYDKAVNGGLLKIFSKMGISTLQSYQGAQIFEALGIRSDVINKYFTGTVSRIEGIGLDEMARERLMTHRLGYPALINKPANLDYLRSGGDYAWRKDGERHLFSPNMIRLLQHASATNDHEKFKAYTKEVDDQAKAAFTLRGLLEFQSDRKPVPLDEVEPAENIFKRFATGAMSFGSISWEAHTCLAIAMNRLGGKSNSGEGGEDPVRFKPLENGDSMISRIKQVASGRFGVTSHYLTNADELQIKMAQGAKPGEGGQLPGHKVDAWIGRTRKSTPGVGLISPPPHHDIYSIEDLAQLIYDLKNANRDARVNVKLVSLAGVGTVATGVTKGYADVVLIAGHDGGTGASPLSSIKHAGLPWELGVAETHQTLARNHLRSRVTLQADGQLRTPRDLAIATLLGAEEWGIATAALVVQGCIMMRKCHTNTCPVGIATQDRELRGRYEGQVEHVVNFFTMLVEGLREVMAELGFRSINEMVGQSQCLKVRENLDHWKFKHLDLSPLLHKEEALEGDTLYKSVEQKHLIHDIIDRKLITDAAAALEKGEKVNLAYDIHNTDRSVGAMLSNEISKRYEADGLPEDTIHVKFNGSAGQSFGVFTAKGVSFELEGDANDYFGKGLSGGRLVAYPDHKAPFEPRDNIIVGNVAFFGGTDGEAFIRGQAGERFCVRNSGVTAVVEGVGDHGCEYMTGGKAVILGETGRNFAAGMSGGVAYVLNRSGAFASRCNTEMVRLGPLEDQDEIAMLKSLVQKHHEYTGSDKAKELLDNWDTTVQEFVRVMPVDYERMQNYMKQVREQKQLDDEYEIAVEAFDMHMKNLADSKATA